MGITKKRFILALAAQIGLSANENHTNSLNGEIKFMFYRIFKLIKC